MLVANLSSTTCRWIALGLRSGGNRFYSLVSFQLSRILVGSFALMLIASSCGASQVSNTRASRSATGKKGPSASQLRLLHPFGLQEHNVATKSLSLPPARLFSAVAYDPAHRDLVLFSGRGASQHLLSDTWIWDGTSWTQAHPKHTPPAREYASLAVAPISPSSGDLGTVANSSTASSDDLVLFGGVGSRGNLLSDTWIWNGSDWIHKHPSLSPPARQGAAMTISASTKGFKTILFGGVDKAGNLLDDTWAWNGSNWALEHPSQSPPARAYASISIGPSYLSANSFTTLSNQVPILFGGLSRDGPSPIMLNDTWEWNGETWIRLFPKTSPSPRQGAVFAYLYTPVTTTSGLQSGETSPEHLEDTLFGGTTGGVHNPTVLDDTWEWNGSTWIEEFPATSPPQIVGGVMSIAPGPYVGDPTDQPSNSSWSNFEDVFVGIPNKYDIPNSKIETWSWNTLSWSPGVVSSSWATLIDTFLTALAAYDHAGRSTLGLSQLSQVSNTTVFTSTKIGRVTDESRSGVISDSVGSNQSVNFDLYLNADGSPRGGLVTLIRSCNPSDSVVATHPNDSQSCQQLMMQFLPINNQTPISVISHEIVFEPATSKDKPHG